jgi:hypothetical protein
LNKEHEDIQRQNKLLGDREAELENQVQRLIQSRELDRGAHAAEVRKLKVERDIAQEKYEDLVRKHQEESFKQMSTARWLPSEDSKVITELGRIKRDMRNWAKAMAVKGIEALNDLDDLKAKSLLEDLSEVAVLENEGLPGGLTTPKSPALLLNALLAHHLFTTLFRSPFFFLLGIGDKEVDVFQEIYTTARNRKQYMYLHVHRFVLTSSANDEEAHAWRSHTLRLLLPPLGANSQEGERRIHSITETLIAKVVEKQASTFMDGSARYLFESNSSNENTKKKLTSIYQEAATLSYRLWTQRTTLRCVTLTDLKNPTFNAESEYLKPHSLVRYEDHDDQLKGRPIMLIVHPLLEVFGTNEGKEYDSSRVWAAAEVWLDSKCC